MRLGELTNSGAIQPNATAISHSARNARTESVPIAAFRLRGAAATETSSDGATSASAAGSTVIARPRVARFLRRSNARSRPEARGIAAAVSSRAGVEQADRLLQSV